MNKGDFFVYDIYVICDDIVLIYVRKRMNLMKIRIYLKY